MCNNWASSRGYGTYHIGDQRRVRRACASTQSCQSRRYSHTRSMEVDEGSDQKSDIYPHWMAVHALSPLNGWACAVKICHDGMLEDTNSLDGAHLVITFNYSTPQPLYYTIVWVQANFRVSYPNRVVSRVKYIGYIVKGVLNSHLESNPDQCYIQNRVITNRVVRRFRCIPLLAKTVS